MSAYISFYIRSNANEFLPIKTVSRSAQLFQAFDNIIPYEKNKPLTKEDIEMAMNFLKERKERYHAMIDCSQNNINAIVQMNNSVEDKLEAIYEEEQNIEEIEEEFQYIDWAIADCQTMLTLIQGAEDSKFCTNPKHQYDPNNYIWGGYEAGYPDEEEDE